MQPSDIIQKLESLANPEAIKGMARFGTNPEHTYLISIPNLRETTRETWIDHDLAKQLWTTGIHKARILTGMIDNPMLVTGKQMEAWVKDFDSWDICDRCCMNLSDKIHFAYKNAADWSEREEEFIKREGFALMAVLAFHDKKTQDERFLKFLAMIKQESTDQRTLVKKAMNWALRQIGERDFNLNRMAIKRAEDIKDFDTKSAKWIASDAIRALTSEGIQKRLTKMKQYQTQN